MSLYYCASAPMATTAAPAMLATGTVIRTMLQIATPATQKITVVKWGVQFATVPTAPVTCELVETGAIPATALTAHVAAGVQPYDDSGAPASGMTLGVNATGYFVAAAAEGAIAATRHADLQIISATNQYVWEWSLGREFEVNVSRFLRVRMTTATTINAYTWIVWEE
jgi:hypothetical protein